MVAGVAGLPEPPVPASGRVKRFASDLPVQQIDLLSLIAVRLHTYVLVFFPNTVNLSQGRVQLVVVKVVQGVERVHQIKVLVRPGK